ncbi:MAG: methyltransferase domain-containing protein [Myxococcota bacterium]
MSGSTKGPGRGGTQPPVSDPAAVAALSVQTRQAVTVPAGQRTVVVRHEPDTRAVEGHEHDACEQLHDRMLGELVLRHSAGVRVLDLGRGVPRLTSWVAERAATLEVVDALDLGRGDTIRLPWPDASFSMVYCVRTLPHLGRDAPTSERAAASALAEIGRVLTPGGTALVEIDNPLSLWGAAHGLRRPAKALEPGPMCIESARGVTRFDTLRVFVGRLPSVLRVTDVHGLRIVAPVPHLLAIPIVGRVLARLEWAFRDRAIVSRMGGHLLVVLRHSGPNRPDPSQLVAGDGELVG